MLTIKSEGLEITHGWLVEFLEKISEDNIEGFYPTDRQCVFWIK